MESPNDWKKPKTNGIGSLKTLFQIKRPYRSVQTPNTPNEVQSATLPSRKTKHSEDEVRKDRLFIRHQSYRTSSRKSKYKKSTTSDHNPEKKIVAQSNVKTICQKFELAEFDEGSKHKQYGIPNSYQKNHKEQDQKSVVQQVLQAKDNQLNGLKELNENVETKRRTHAKDFKHTREKKIQSFVDAENEEEREEYRKLLINTIDSELAHMKEDGFFDENKNVSMEETEIQDSLPVEELFWTPIQTNDQLVEQCSLAANDFSIKDNPFLVQLGRNKVSDNSDSLIATVKTNKIIDKETRPEVVDEEKDSYTKRKEDLLALRNRYHDDDEFSESLGEGLENGLYIVEAYNDEGRELIEVQVMIDRRSINIDSPNSSIDEALKQSDMIFYEKDDNTFNQIRDSFEFSGSEENSQTENTNAIELTNTKDVEDMCELMKQTLTVSNSNSEPLYEYIEIKNEDSPNQPFFIFAPLSNRSTIYSTTSQESSVFEDDDEGIDLCRNKDHEEVYQNVRRETFCDDKGIVRIERVACSENIPFINESVSAPISRHNSITTCKRLEYIIDEIQTTETKYVEDLAKVIKVYKPYIESHTPLHLCDYQGYLFGNLEKIYRRQREFSEELKKCSDVDQVIQCISDHAPLFELYPSYFKNKPRSDMLLKDFTAIIKDMQEKFEERLDFSAYLLTPVQRLGKYILFLENIEKELEKLDLPTDNAKAALKMIRDEMSNGNDSVAIESIENSPISKTDYGSFKMREKFNINKPRRIEAAMVFLFTNVVVFTTIDPRNLELFYYYDSIKMNDLRIASFDDYTIHLTDFTKSKKKQNSTRYTYVLETKTEKSWKLWKEAIEKILWDQLVQVKESFLSTQTQNRRRYKVNRNKIRSTGSSVFYTD